MKKVISISVDEAMLKVINPRNLSKYFNDLLTADVVEQEKGRLTAQMENYLLNSSRFVRYVQDEVQRQIENMRQGY